MAHHAPLAFATLVVRGERLELTQAMACNAVLAPLKSVGYARQGLCRFSLVAAGAGFDGASLMIRWVWLELASTVTKQAILVALGRMRNRRHLKQRETVGRSCDGQKQGENG